MGEYGWTNLARRAGEEAVENEIADVQPAADLKSGSAIDRQPYLLKDKSN